MTPRHSELRIRPTRRGRFWLAVAAVTDAIGVGALSFIVVPPRFAAAVLGAAIVAAVVLPFRVSLRLVARRVEVVNRFRSYDLRLDEIRGFDEGQSDRRAPLSSPS